jgi:hypothetical protein
VESFIADVEAALTDGLKLDRLYAEYLECAAQRGRTHCLAELSNALYAATAAGANSYFSTHSTPALLAKVGPDALWSVVSDKMQAQDDITRVAALLLVSRTPELELRSLPVDVYRNLAAKSDIEAQLILQGHELLRLPDDASRAEAYARASDPEASDRVRVAAARALAHAEDGATLAQLTEHVMQEGPSSVSGFALPFALGQCGLACDGTLRSLASSSQKWLRRVAYGAVWMTPHQELVAGYKRDFAEVSAAPAADFESEFQAARYVGTED